MAAASATSRADGVSSAPTGPAIEATSPVRVQYGATDDDGGDSGDNARSPVPQTPSSLPQSRAPPQIAPPGDASAPSVARQIVPGIGIKMSAKETKRLRRSEIEKRSRERRQVREGRIITNSTESLMERVHHASFVGIRVADARRA
jgi:hypothetical protein